ncbi:MAG: membrane protein insertion efficiency factor YidD [Rhabdochlamydiaceae bacterium]
MKAIISSLFYFLFVCPCLSGTVGYVDPWGSDAHLISHHIKKPPSIRSGLSLFLAEKVILFHQNILSPVDGPRSHFRPTSSMYMLQAMKKHGFLKGYALGCDRLLRENDDNWVYRKKWIKGQLYKYDPVP